MLINMLKKSEYVRKKYHGIKDFFYGLKYFSGTKKGLKYFIVVCQARTGSTLLMDLLGSHPNIKVDHHSFFKIDNLKHKITQQKANTRKFCRGFKFRLYDDGKEYDFSKMYQFFCSLDNADIKMIHLIRKNQLRQSLSAEVVDYYKKIGLTRLHSKDKNPEIPKIKVDIQKTLNRINYSRKLLKAENDLLKHFRHHTVNYEKDLLHSTDHQKTSDKIFAFLGLPSAKVSSDYRKTSIDNPSEYIDNFNQLRLHYE